MRARANGSRRRSAAWLMASLAICSAAQAASQDEPFVVGGETSGRWIDFDTPKITLDLLARYSDAKAGSGQSASQTHETLFRETLEASTNGYIVSPAVLSLDLLGRYGLTQDFVGGDTSDSGNGHVYEYDVRARIFSQGMFPLTLYARRTEELVFQAFTSSINSINTTYGADLGIRWKTLPSTIRVYHTELQQEFLDGSSDFTLKQDTIEYHGSHDFTPTSILTIDYAFNDSEQTSSDFAPEQFQTHDGTITHTYSFGPDQRSNLRSTVGAYVQTGGFDSERYRLDEYLRLYHGESLETWYTYQFQRSTYGDSTQDEHRGQAGLRHRLFKSLTTTVNVGGSYLDLNGDSKTTEEFASLSLDYTKKVAYGRLSLNAGMAVNFQQNSARSEPIPVLDQAFAFNAGLPIIINRQDIDPNSIRITGPQNIRLYRPGTDYTVAAFPGRVEIRRVLTGDIPLNGAVLVDYQLLPESAFDLQTFVYNFGGRYDIQEGLLSGLGIYARYMIQTQEITSGNATAFIADDVNDLTVGLDYRIWKLLFRAEYRQHESTLSPYSETRYEAQYTDRVARDLAVSLQAIYTQLSYDTSEVNVLLMTATADYSISRELFLTGSATYLNQEDALTGSTRGLDAQLNVRWKHRQTEIYGGFRYADLTSDDSQERSLLFQIGIRRDF